MRARCGLFWGDLGMPCTQWLGFWGLGITLDGIPGKLRRGCYTLQLAATADRGVLAALGRASEGRRGGDALAWARNSAGTGLGFFQ